VVLLTAGFGFRNRLNKLKKEKRAQEEFSRKLLKSQEEERKRLANELHDSVAHDILILKNNAVIGMNKVKDEETKSILNEISEQSSSTLNEVRNISYNLHPHQLESLGLTKAIKSIIDKASKSTEINFKLDADIIDKI
jgi:signal transduction histidine kinase